MKITRLLHATGLLLFTSLAGAREFYQDSRWQPRAHIATADALGGTFWPASPAVKVTYDTPGFASNRLSAVPAPGVHPRVLVSPADVDAIRAQLARGEAAPPEFRTMWTRVTRSRSAFYALVAKDDALGHALAAQLVANLHALEPKLERLDAQPDHENLWSVERSLNANGDPDPPSEIWTLLDYDYLHGWMSPAEREFARRVIARVIHGRISNFMTMPDHFMINNHEGFGMEFVRLMLLIEGEPGFEPAAFQLAAHKAGAMLDWYLSPDGMCYESIKGWLNTSAFVAIGRRERELLHHDHLVAKMRFFQAALRWEDGHWQIRDEMRASAFHVIWMMRYLYPENPGFDLLYHASLKSHPFLTDAAARWPNPVGVSPELLLLFAGGGVGDDAGHRADWTSQAAIDALKVPVTWQDDARGYVETRNSWTIGDLHLGFTCKQDFFYGGHEGSEANRLTLWHGGVNWIRDINMLAGKATFIQNMLTVDGRGLEWPPAPGVWLGVHDSPQGLTAAGDAKIAYSYSKVMQVHPLNFPSGKLGYYAPFTEGNFDLTRDQQIAFHPGTVKWNDGYAHTDYGPWSGETRLVEDYRTSNPMAQAYRTVHLARGAHPYVLVLDDARKADDLSHLFEANFTLPEDTVLIDAKSPAVSFQQVEPAAGRDDEFLFARAGTPRDPATGKPLVKKGDPLLLVRVLWRNTDYGFPVPRFQQINGSPERSFQRFSQLVVPAVGRSPEFRLLFYPHRQGDPMPVTTWNSERTELVVRIQDQLDRYRFGRTDGGRSVFSFTRNDAPALANPAPPARPVLLVRGERYDANDHRTTRREGERPVYPFGGELAVGFERVSPPAVIRYTLDGSEPAANSPEFDAPFIVRTTATLKARRFNPAWPGDQRASGTLSALLEKRPIPGATSVPAAAPPGLLARVYELPTHLWNNRGFFTANKIMLPDLDLSAPLCSVVSAGFALPHVVPARPITDQAKGFYRFNGWFRAEAAGTYQFAVNSCGPVLLTVAGQDAVAEVGEFHQQQSLRRGSVVLGAGWHPLELIVTDPLFWNIATTGVMPFDVSVRREAGDFAPVAAEALRAEVPAGWVAETPPAPQWKEAAAPPVWTEPGVVLSCYDRDGLSRSPDYLDIDALAPRRSERVTRLIDNVNAAQVLVDDAWFHAPQDGIYRFDLPVRRAQAVHLGDFRAAYQNQLRIDGEVVVQHGVAGRLPFGAVGLKAGWHALSLRLGSSPAEGGVTYPDGQRLPLTAGLLARDVTVAVHPVGQPEGRTRWEIFAPTQFVLGLPVDRVGELRYTLDGSVPTAQSQLFTAPFNVDATTEVTAVAFADGRVLTPPSRVRISRVDQPTAGLIAQADFTRWDGTPGITALDERCRVWIQPAARLAANAQGPRALAVSPRIAGVDGPANVDINLTRGLGQVGFKLSGLRMRDPAFTVGVWFMSETADGRIFGKEGLTAFGKSYHTVSCVLEHGRLRADPGHLGGGQIKPGEWHHVVLAASPETVTLYLDGQPLGATPGAPGLTTDALDFFTDHPAAVAKAVIYNRELTPGEIARWFAHERDAVTPRR